MNVYHNKLKRDDTSHTNKYRTRTKWRYFKKTILRWHVGWTYENQCDYTCIRVLNTRLGHDLYWITSSTFLYVASSKSWKMDMVSYSFFWLRLESKLISNRFTGYLVHTRRFLQSQKYLQAKGIICFFLFLCPFLHGSWFAILLFYSFFIEFNAFTSLKPNMS